MAREFGDATLVPEGFPAIHPQVFQTKNGTLYLKQPGVVLVAAPAVNISGMADFLAGFPTDYEFGKYLEDPTLLSSSDQLVKLAGQVCYASYGPKRTLNVDVEKYFGNLISSGHGSVLEHANFSLLLYGISRSCSHEIVRHRAGAAYSQLSQRYVSGKVLRFVERPEYQNNPELHQEFMTRIDRASEEYESIADKLESLQNDGEITLSAEQKTDRRKRVQQTARSVLPNETETVMVMTANIRAWRHIISMRVNEHAETEIRQVMFGVFKVLRQVAPNLFSDYEISDLPDGTQAVRTPYPKV